MAKKAYWDFMTSDMGAYVKCTYCGKKLSAKEFLFADVPTETCPKCGATMNFSRIKYGLLAQEALNER